MTEISLCSTQTANREDELRRKHKKYVISLKNKYKIYFDVLVELLVIYSVISSLYFLAFVQPAIGFQIFNILV